jgi:hypothetical protein
MRTDGIGVGPRGSRLRADRARERQLRAGWHCVGPVGLFRRPGR